MNLKLNEKKKMKNKYSNNKKIVTAAKCLFVLFLLVFTSISFNLKAQYYGNSSTRPFHWNRNNVNDSTFDNYEIIVYGDATMANYDHSSGWGDTAIYDPITNRTTIKYKGNPKKGTQHFGFDLHNGTNCFSKFETWTRGDTGVIKVPGNGSTIYDDPHGSPTGNEVLHVILKNLTTDVLKFNDIGFKLLDSVPPLSVLNEVHMPLSVFTPAGIPADKVLAPGESVTFDVYPMNTNVNRFLVVYQTTEFVTPGHAYTGKSHTWLGSKVYGTNAIPTLSEWGMIIFTFLLLVAGVVYIRRRQVLGQS